MRFIYFLFLLLLMPGIACADVMPFAPPPDDISLKILGQMFGGLMNYGGLHKVDGIDAFGKVIFIFNSACLTIGGLLVGYSLLRTTVGTAHDGKVLGSKTSIYLPIRIALGTAVVLPVLPGGYCFMSYFVMYAVVQGVGFADAAWAGYMDSPAVSANLTVPTNSKSQLMKTIEDTFVASACVEAQKAMQKDSLIQDASDILGFKNRTEWDIKQDGDIYYAGDHKGVFSYFSKKKCGWIKMPKKLQQMQSAKGAASDEGDFLGNLDDLFQTPDLSVLNDAHKTATSLMIKAVRLVAIDAVENRKEIGTKAEGYYKKLEVIRDTYLLAIQGVTKIVAKSSNESSKGALKYGWIMAGPYYNSIVNFNQQINTSMNNYPTSSASLQVGNAIDVEEDVLKYMIAGEVLSARGPEYGNAMLTAKDKEKERKQEETGYMGRFATSFTESFADLNLYELKNDRRHPIITVADMCGRLLVAYAALTAAMTAFSLLALVPGAAGAVGSALQVLTSFLDLPIKALVATAFVGAYLIPLLPFMIFLGVIGGWLISVVIAILVAPMWAIMHMHPNGDDVAGKGANGYMLLLGVLLRPVLVILGFIAAISISTTLGIFINKVYFQVFSFSQMDGVMGFFKIIGGTIMYVIIEFTFIKKTLSLMHVIPDEAMKWVGGGSDGLGTYAKTMGEAGQSGAAAIGGFLGGAASNLKMSEKNQQNLSNAAASFKGGGKKESEEGNNSLPNITPGGNKEGGGGGEGETKKDFISQQKAFKNSNPGEIMKSSINESINEEDTTDARKLDNQNNLSNAVRNLGNDSQGFMQEVMEKQQSNPGQSMQNNINSAYSTKLNEKYGYGAGQIIKNVGEGNIHSDKANLLQKSYQDTSELLKEGLGSEQAVKKMSESNSGAYNSYKLDPQSTKNGGSVPLSNYVESNLNSLRDIAVEAIANKNNGNNIV